MNDLKKEYPLYPSLPEQAAKEAQEIIEEFKKELSKAAEEAIGTLYCDITPHIESDHWTNYRNQIVDGFRNYGNRMVQGEYDFKKIRQTIYEEFREELIVDINQDLVEENERLKVELKQAYEMQRGF